MTQRGGLQCKAARNGVWVPRATSRRGEGGATQPGLDAPPTSHAPSRRWLYSPGAGARRGTAGTRWSGSARPKSGGLGRRPERGGPGRRPERGGPTRRPGAAPAALAAGLLAARWHGPGCPGTWLLAAAKLGLAAAREETRGEREAERETSGGE